MTATRSSSREPGTSYEPTSISISGGSSRRLTSAARASVRPGSPSEDPTQTTSASRGALEQEAGQLARGDVAERGRGDAGVLDGQQLRLVGVAAEHLTGLLEARPRLAREQPGRDPRGGQQQAQPGGHYCCGASGAGAPGVAVAEGAAGFIQFGAGALERQLLAVQRAVAGVDGDLGLARPRTGRRCGPARSGRWRPGWSGRTARVAGAGSLISLTATRAWSSETPLPSFSAWSMHERREDQRHQGVGRG